MSFPCKDGWIYYKSSCYLLVDTHRACLDARQACAEIGAYLVSINGRDEDDFVFGQMAVLGIMEAFVGALNRVGDQTGRKLGKWLSTNSPSAWLIRGATALNITAQSAAFATSSPSPNWVIRGPSCPDCKAELNEDSACLNWGEAMVERSSASDLGRTSPSGRYLIRRCWTSALARMGTIDSGSRAWDRLVQKDQNSLRLVQKKQNSSRLVQKDQNSLRLVQKKQNSSRLVQKDQNSSRLVQKDQNSLRLVQKKQNSSRLVQKDQNSSRLVQKKQNSSRLVQKNQNSSRLVQKKQNSSRLVQKDQNSSRLVQKDQNSSRLVQTNQNSLSWAKKNQRKTFNTNQSKTTTHQSCWRVYSEVGAAVVVVCEGRAAAVTGRCWVGVSDDPPLVPGDDCTLREAVDWALPGRPIRADNPPPGPPIPPVIHNKVSLTKELHELLLAHPSQDALD
ncbi:hypothetical protein MAR_031931, partial [Mya arenaria]